MAKLIGGGSSPLHQQVQVAPAAPDDELRKSRQDKAAAEQRRIAGASSIHAGGLLALTDRQERQAAKRLLG